MLIGNMFEFFPKSKRSASYGTKSGKYPFLKSSNIINSFVDVPDYDGEYLVIGDGGTGNSKYIVGKFSVSDHNYVLKPKKGVNPKAVNYFLKRDNYEVLNKGFKGIGIKNVSKDYIQKIEYHFNTIYTEKEIVDSLELIEEAINIEMKELSLLDELIKSRFIEMFLCSHDYPITKWEDVLRIYNGKDYKNNISDKTNGYPVYGSGGFMGIYADNYICDGIITIIGRKGTIDRPFLVKGKIWNIDTAFGIKTNSDILNPIYFHYRSKFYDYQGMNKQTTKPSLKKTDLLKLKIELPPMDKQLAFVSFVNQVDKLKFITKYNAES